MINSLPANVIQRIIEGKLLEKECKEYANMSDALECSAGFIALDNHHLELAKTLLLLQTDLNKLTTYGWSIYHLIARENAITLLNEICSQRKIDVNFLLSPNASKQDCLTVAALCNSQDVLLKLLALLKTEKSAEDLKKIATPALIEAAKEDNVECFNILWNEGVDLATCQNPETNENFIHLLIRCNAVKTLEAIKTKLGLTALHELWWQGRKSPQSPLECAIRLNHWEAAKIFLSMCRDGMDTLQWLAYLKIIENESLMQQASNLSHPEIDGMTPTLMQYKVYKTETQTTGFDYGAIPIEHDPALDEMDEAFNNLNLSGPP